MCLRQCLFRNSLDACTFENWAKFWGQIVVETELQEIHECQSETNIGTQLNSPITTANTRQEFIPFVFKQKILCPRISTLTGTTLAPPVMTEQYWYTCPITTYYRTNLTTIIVGLSLMLKKMNESNLPRPILGVSSEKWCCNQLSVNLSTKLEQSSYVNFEGKIHYETGKIVLMVSFSLYHLDCVHFPSFLFVLLSVFEYWSLIVFVIFIFSACVMICRWIMIFCWLTQCSFLQTLITTMIHKQKSFIHL